MSCIRLRRSRDLVTAADLDRARSLEPTYAEVGSTLSRSLPNGYRHDRESIDLGRGDERFSLGCAAVRAWAAHTYIGARVFPDDAPIQVASTVIVALARGPFVLVAPCRIVWVVEEANRFGFAYGTLPGHPEIGEESFTVVHDSDGTVRFEIVAFSRPQEFIVRVGGPVSRMAQRCATAGYLEGIRRFVDTGLAV